MDSGILTTSDLIVAVHNAGGTIQALDGTLRLAAPRPLPSELLERLKAHKSDLLNALRQPLSLDGGSLRCPETLNGGDIAEHLAERSAIQEFDGRLTRQEAESDARRNLRVFEYRLMDAPKSWLILIAPGYTFAEAAASLGDRFGTRLLEVRQRR